VILQDDSTTLTFDVSGNNSPDNELDVARTSAAGGAVKQSVAGERFFVTEQTLVTGSELRSLLNLMNSNFTQLYYTPDDIPAEMTIGDFPLPVSVNYKGKKERWYNGEIQYVVTLEIESTDYL
jgi:hypothetical protein